MLPRYRVQVRKPIVQRAANDPGLYVFRDLDLPFVPMPGVLIEDIGEERFAVEQVTWHEGQHRFVVYTLAHQAADGENAASHAVAELEGKGWQLNRRAGERSAA